ncbi:MAG TPA: hypothetical protein VFH45_12625 [Acidimicrobiales bacterium]|nr:hypothetical protein [Acidimicrobiales bacterium]
MKVNGLLAAPPRARERPIPAVGVAGVLAAVAGGVLVTVSAAVHLRLYALGYKGLPTVGALFLAQGVAGAVLGPAVAVLRRPAACLLGAGYMAASIGGFLTALWFGLFGFRDGFYAPYAGLAFAVEVAGVVVLVGAAAALWLSWRRREEAGPVTG